MRFLLAAHPNVGHTNPLRAIGRSLQRRGHAVAFATTVIPAPPRWVPFPGAIRTAAEIAGALVADGFELVALRPSLRALRHAALAPFSRGYDELRHAIEMFGTTMASDARTLAAAIDTFKAQIVVGDFLLYGSYLAARMRGLPFVAFYHSALPFPVPGRSPFGSGLRDDAPRDAAWAAAERALASLSSLAYRKVCDASAQLGVRPPARGGLLERPYSDDLNLLATTRSLEPGLPEMPANVHFVGPCLEGRAEPAEHPAFKALGPGLNVYVSLGTLYNTDARLFGQILRGLDRTGVRVVVSAGNALEALRRRPPSSNAALFARVPQLGVLRAVDVVVSHGGNNTTLEALAAGKPLIVIPFGGDQAQNARRVELLGAGVALSPERLDPRGVASAFERALSCRERAAAIGHSLAGVDGTAASVTLLEALAP